MTRTDNKKILTLEEVLAYYREAAHSKRGLGDSFERLIAQYLLADPQYADRLSDVWLWSEWPDRWTVDVGIDLVARERSTGDYWAIQCKFFDPDSYLQKSEIDSFFTASGKKFATKEGARHFAHRLIISTTDKWSKHAEEALADQVTPVNRLWFKDLANSPIDWSSLDIDKPGKLKLKKKYPTKHHQGEAIEQSIEGFKTADRGKLIMACGTGKTFTALRLTEQQTPKNGLVLFLAPSISLVSQTLREWSAQAIEPFHAFVVCSDSKVGKEEEDIKTHDLAYPATTDAKALARTATLLTKDRRTVVFCTYQSIQVISDAQKLGLDNFDLAISDEAHRTTGLTLATEDHSEFVKIHDNQVVKAAKRLYMTATPRIYGEASKTKAGEKEATLFSMDDEEIFGQTFYRLGFGKAVELDLLAEYKVVIVAVEETAMAKLANDYNNAYKLDEKKAVDIRFVTKIIGTWKGLSKRGLVEIDGEEQVPLQEDMTPMRRAVAFSRSIKDSKQTTEVFAQLVGMYNKRHAGEETNLVQCELHHVDGTMNALVRLSELAWLKSEPEEGSCRILSNARCLSEGIDVPALDAVAFFDTRESIVDIVQSVGRVMRKAPGTGKKYGYIILPVCIPSTKVAKYNDYIDSDPQFKGIWRVIKALRAHDESLVDEAEFRRKITVITGGGKKGGGEGWKNQDLPLDFPDIPLDAVTEAVYAAVPKKLGDREYWSQWARDVVVIAERLITRIKALLEKPKPRKAFEAFLKGLRENLNPTVGEEEAIEMLAQHIITRPVFEALFDTYSFTTNNPVSSSMQQIVELLDAHEVDSETESLQKFYGNIRDRVSLAKSDKSRQDVIRNLYETFFSNAFPRVRDRLGIVYTPVEVVDFIIQSVEVALQRHFNASMSDTWVQLLDPFTGTGTFPVRLLQSRLIKPEDLKRKFQNELHANEIVLLAYYIATINIESAYYELTGEHLPFEGIVLTDTFQMNEAIQGDLERGFSEENSKRAKRQRKLPIRVVFSNPPYSAQQDSENDNNKNLKYPALDARIGKTYAAQSKAKLLKNLYDSYVRAIRWASDRIENQGIVAFVTNGSFLDANNMDGLRKCLVEDFSYLYIFNCRGNQRTQGEESRKEGGKIFGSGSRTPVAISILVKQPSHKGPGQLYYYDIGDYLSKEEKLAKLEELGSIAAVEWQVLNPNCDGDWASQRDPAFELFFLMGNKDEPEVKSFFTNYSLGVSTNRDAWVYNSSKTALEKTTRRLIDNFNSELKRCANLVSKDKDSRKASYFVERDPKKIAWSSTLLGRADREDELVFDANRITLSSYRPFNKQWQYLGGGLNDRPGQAMAVFPTENHRTPVISVTGQGASKSFSCLVVDSVPNLHFHDTGQYFPLYWYEKIEKDDRPKGDLFSEGAEPDERGYVRRDGISDWALGLIQAMYSEKAVTKEDVFWYVYGVLHSPEYRQRFAVDLKKGLPRLPLTRSFWAFSRAGKELGALHLNYETLTPFEVQEDFKRLVMHGDDYKVSKMVFGKREGKADKSVIVYNENLTLRGIPAKAYEYQVNGKPAIEWVMERYQVSVDKDSGIRNDPNSWSENPRYVVDLIKRVVRVSVESAKIISGLPPLQEMGD